MTVGTKEGDIDWWLPGTTVYMGQKPWDNQAYYYPYSNQVMVCHTGISLLFTPNPEKDKAKDIENLGYLATTIGYEMGNAFDKTDRPLCNPSDCCFAG